MCFRKHLGICEDLIQDTGLQLGYQPPPTPTPQILLFLTRWNLAVTNFGEQFLELWQRPLEADTGTSERGDLCGILKQC